MQSILNYIKQAANRLVAGQGGMTRQAVGTKDTTVEGLAPAQLAKYNEYLAPYGGNIPPLVAEKALVMLGAGETQKTESYIKATPKYYFQWDGKGIYRFLPTGEDEKYPLIESVVIPTYTKMILDDAFMERKVHGIDLSVCEVTYIGYRSFMRTSCEKLILGKYVETIVSNAFAGNYITEIDLLETRYIGAGAFSDNDISVITIGNEVQIDIEDKGTMGNNYGFEKTYDSTGKKGGTYVFDGDSWYLKF